MRARLVAPYFLRLESPVVVVNERPAASTTAAFVESAAQTSASPREAAVGIVVSEMEKDIVSDEELRTLSDDDLVALIERRSNLRGTAAREALAIIRDEIPPDVDF